VELEITDFEGIASSVFCETTAKVCDGVYEFVGDVQEELKEEK